MSPTCIWNFRCLKLFFDWLFLSSSFFTKMSVSNFIFLTKKTIVVLIKSFDWDEWIMIINFMIKRSDIDEYVNLIKSKFFESVKFEMLIFFSIKNEITSSKNLIEDERRDLLMMRDDFKKTVRTYREKFEALKVLNLHILITVNRFDLIYLMNEDTNIVFRKLSVLKKRLVLTNCIREMKIIRRYRDLQQSSKHQQLNRWLIEWEQMYVATTRLKLSDIQRHRTLFDFLIALRIVDVAFVVDKKAILKDKIHRNKDLSTLKDLLKNFHNHLRTTRVLTSLMTNESCHSAFATLQKHSSNCHTSDCGHSHDDKSNLKCLCKSEHRLRDCFYALIKNRLSKWKPDSKIEALVTEKIARSEPLRKKIYMTKKIVNENTTDLKFKNFNFNFAKPEFSALQASTPQIPRLQAPSLSPQAPKMTLYRPHLQALLVENPIRISCRFAESWTAALIFTSVTIVDDSI